MNNLFLTNFGDVLFMVPVPKCCLYNSNFFAIDDFDCVPDDELYERLLNEFPAWLKEAKAKKIIR